MGNSSSSNTNLSNPKNRLLEEHHLHDKLNKPHNATSRVSFLRSPLPWLFMFLFFLPLILISTTGGGGRKTCSPTYPHLTIKDQTNSSSVVLKDPEEQQEEEDDVPPRVPSLYHPRRPRMFNTTLDHVVFGIAASSVLWETRKEYIKSWWRPGKTRGVVWIDKKVRTYRNEPLPQIRISQDTSRFRFLLTLHYIQPNLTCMTRKPNFIFFLFLTLGTRIRWETDQRWGYRGWLRRRCD